MKGLFIFSSCCALTGLIPFIWGLTKFNNLNNIYYSFILFLGIGCITDITARILLIYHYYDTARQITNFYLLFESMIFIYFFYKWKVVTNLLYVLILFFSILFIWVIINFHFKSLSELNTIYNVVYSTVTVLLAITLFQKTYFKNWKTSFKEPFFIISFALILNYSYRAIFESLYVFKLELSNSFYADAFLIFIILNVVSNCLFTFAIHYMSLKIRLTSFY
jgi:hypothetical protein